MQKLDSWLARKVCSCSRSGPLHALARMYLLLSWFDCTPAEHYAVRYFVLCCVREKGKEWDARRMTKAPLQNMRNVLPEEEWSQLTEKKCNSIRKCFLCIFPYEKACELTASLPEPSFLLVPSLSYISGVRDLFPLEDPE